MGGRRLSQPNGKPAICITQINMITLLSIFSINLIASALLVIFSKNPVYSVIFLIYSFVNASAILLCYGLEFISFILIVVYVGAIAVLFLFVVMLLNIRLIEYNESLKKYLPISVLIGLIFMTQISSIFSSLFINNLYENSESVDTNFVNVIHPVTNIQHIGQFLYTEYAIHFLLSSIVLLIAMIGAIFLTYRGISFSKKQEIYKQVSRAQSGVINYT